MVSVDSRKIREQVEQITTSLLEEMPLSRSHLLVMGVSTSEVAGRRIGTSGNNEVAVAIWEGALAIRQRYGYHLAFQCCEHLNRALVMDRETMERFGYEEVHAVPVPDAGGSMASHAFRNLKDGVLVESVAADAGIDIGDTLIGMHLKPVAVPVRASVKQVGAAHVTMAKTRPKLIGGARAVYELKPTCHG